MTGDQRETAVRLAIINWRNRAVEARQLSSVCYNWETKKILEEVATCYERLADKVEESIILSVPSPKAQGP